MTETNSLKFQFNLQISRNLLERNACGNLGGLTLHLLKCYIGVFIDVINIVMRDVIYVKPDKI